MFSLVLTAFLSIYKSIVRLLASHIKFEKREKLKKELGEELILLAWHPKRWWNFCISEDEKKETEPIFTE